MTSTLRTDGLTDGALTSEPRSASVRDYLRASYDRLLGSDPGLTQLRTALQAVLGIALAVGLTYLFVRVTGALRLPARSAPPAVVAAHDHGLLLVCMLLAGMVAMMAGFTVGDRTARGQLLTTVYLPVPMLAALSVGIALGPYRIPSLVWLVALLTAAVYVRRFGPRGFATGLVMFNGAFLGFFLHVELGLSDIGWIAAVLGVGALASLLVRFTLLRPDPTRTLERMRGSWRARARRQAVLCVEVLDAPDAAHRTASSTRLRRQAVRLNESTLMIDAQLADARTASEAAVEHQHLFDAELALSNIARFTDALAHRYPPPDLHRLARDCVAAVAGEDDGGAREAAARLFEARDDDLRTQILAHRLAGSVQSYLDSRQALRRAVDAQLDGRHTAQFQPAVELNNGWLPGSVPVSTQASTTPGRGRFDHATMPPHVRASIQMAVAATLAVVVGDLVSGPRLYWALLATFLAFMATTNSGEQVRKALFRVAGTAVGIVVGDLLVRATGGRVWASLIIVLVALFFGIYLIRINYTFMVIGVTVTMSQLYVQLGEFSWNLLLLRLGETAIGVGAVVLTVLVVVPLRPQRVLATGVLLWFRATTTVLHLALDRLLGAPQRSLRAEVRQLDAAYAALEATAAPLRRGTFGRNSTQLAEIRAVSAALRNYTRSLAVGVEAIPAVPGDALRAADRQLRASMAVIDARIELGRHDRYVRSASLFTVVLDGVPREQRALRLALRDLTMVDGALARLARALHLPVVDLETADRTAALTEQT